MNDIKLQTINKVKVVPISGSERKDERPIKGADMFPELYSNIGIIAKKKSGKTQVISNIIQKCAGKDTQIILFSSTVHKDNTYKAIIKWCKKHNINITTFTDIIEGKVNILDRLVKNLGEVGDEEELSDIEEEPEEVLDERYGGKYYNLFGEDDREPDTGVFDEEFTEDEEEEIPFDTKIEGKIRFKRDNTSLKSRDKYQVPEYILILDDMAHILKHPSIGNLLRKNRHYKMKVILSTQYLHDLVPASFKQLDTLLLFKGLPEVKLQKVINDADLSLDIETLSKIYHHATAEKYNFLYIGTREED